MEQYFCTHCITIQLKYCQQCVVCKRSLTVKILGNIKYPLLKTLSHLVVSCKHKQRGCFKPVKLNCVEERVVDCDSRTMSRLNSGFDKEKYEEQQDCEQTKGDQSDMPNIPPSQQPCAGEEIIELKTDLAQFRSYVQKEVINDLQKLTTTVDRIERTLIQSSGNSGLESRAEIVVAGGEGVKSTIVLNVANGKWRCLPATYECEGASSVLNENQMYVTGGSVGELTDAVKELDLSQHNAQWIESHFRLPFVCCGHATVLYQNNLYIIGGRTETRDLALNTIHEVPLAPPYKPEMLCTLPAPKCDHGATMVENKIYVAGGCQQYSNTATNDVIQYDPATKTCKQLKPLPYCVSGAATATWLDKILLIGGLNKNGRYLDSVIMYDVNTQCHHILPKMQKKRAYCTAVVVGNKLIVIGGADERSSRISSVECYDFQTYTWSDMTPMDEPRAYATAVVNYY